MTKWNFIDLGLPARNQFWELISRIMLVFPRQLMRKKLIGHLGGDTFSVNCHLFLQLRFLLCQEARKKQLLNNIKTNYTVTKMTERKNWEQFYAFKTSSTLGHLC